MRLDLPLSGQFHEAVTELVEFAVDAHVAITLSEANIDVLTKNLARLADQVELCMRLSDERMAAVGTALQAVWNVTRPRPSLWVRFARLLKALSPHGR